MGQTITRTLPFLALFAIYGICSLFGYGNDGDTYAMLRTWKTLVTEFRYIPSRWQGYLVPELIIGLSSQIGGFYLSNLMSASASVAALGLLHKLLKTRLCHRTSILLIMGIGLNPQWIIASSSSIDYVYSMFFFIAGTFLWIKDKPVWSSTAFALSVSSRITYGPVVLIVYSASFLLKKYDTKTIIKSLFWFIIMSCLLYFPVFYSSGMNFSFLGFSSGQWSFVQYTARFIYKNIYMWGLPTFIFLLAVFIIELPSIKKGFKQYNQKEKTILYCLVLIFMYTELMFAKLPHEIAYLFPVLFIAAYFLTYFERSSLYLAVLIFLHILYCVVNFDVLNIQYKSGVNRLDFKEAVSAEPGFFVRKGVVLDDLEKRKLSQEFYIKRYRLLR